MRIIQNNPYRTVGLLVGATAKEKERQIRRLKQFIEAEQEPEEDFSFPTLGHIHRTFDSVNEASSKLNLDSDKMNAALFWFYNGNPITDEPAFDAIKGTDLDLVLSIWTKLTSNGEVSQRNASAYSNLGTLYLSGILEGTNTKEALLEQGISLKLKFLESDFIKDFKALATDETFKTTKKELQLLLLNQILAEIEKSGRITSNNLLDILTKQEFSAKEDFLKGFVQKPIEQIEKKIEESKTKRKENKANSIKAANSLLAEIKDLINQLKYILGTTNIKYSSIADKLAMEFFACGRDYFMHFKDTDTDPSDYSMKLFKNAKSYAIGNIAKQQIDENIKDLQEWIEDKPERDKQKLIGDDLQFITSKLERFQNLSDTVANAKDLVDSCKPRLLNIKSELGFNDDFYLKISCAVVGNAQGMLVTAVNEAQENFSTFRNISNLKSVINDAYNVTLSISTMDMLPNLRAQFIKNKEVITTIKNQIFDATASTAEKFGRSAGELTKIVRSGSNSRGRSGSSGCYIATMAYGDYDHPQVIILRQYRDEVLDKSAFGKWFIKTYYHYSPKLVERLKNKKAINAIIRKSLNRFIKLIK